MEIIRKLLADKLAYYQEAKRWAEQKEENATSEHLCVKVMRGKYRYYLISERGDSSYIPRGEIGKAAELAEQEYARELVNVTQRNIRLIQAFLSRFNEDAPGAVYDRLHPARKALVKPIVISDEEYAKRWMAEEYEQKEKGTGALLLTNDGNLVRSKSEREIYNRLNAARIPFRYEEAAKRIGRNIHPDFTILIPAERRVVYWEHMGMLTMPEYAQDAIRRLALYARKGIVPGRGLIITAESQECPLQADAIDAVIEKLAELGCCILR